MKKIVKMSLAASMLMGVSSVSLQAADILTNIKADGQIRARYERVDMSNNNAKNANAYTNRLAVGVGADVAGQDWVSVYAQMTNVSSISDHYGYAGNPRGYDIVNDGKQTRLTQAYVDLKYADTLLRVGRQAVNLDNLRFIGSVDWRQMPQTFDAIALVNSSIKNLGLLAAYVSQVNRVDTDDNIPTLDTSALVLHASYQIIPELNITAYDYMIGAGTAATELENASGIAMHKQPGAGIGFDTYGIFLDGKTKLSEDTSVRYRAEYARQKDPSMKLDSAYGKSYDVKADYYDLELGVDVKGFLACAQYEVLGADTKNGNNWSFQTPLATLHAHNGWADVFGGVMGTPLEGLEDLNVSLGYKSDAFGMFKVTYHDFSSNKKSLDYGHEVDAIYTRAIPGVNGLTGMLKYANFKKDSEFNKATGFAGNALGLGFKTNSVQKFWAMLDYKFATK